MTEQEWLTSNDPVVMLKAFNFTKDSIQGKLNPLSDRQLRLFAAECVRIAYDGEVKTKPEEPPGNWTPAYWATTWASRYGPNELPEQQTKSALLRDIIGNPWRPVNWKCVSCDGTGGKLYYEPGLLVSWCNACDGRGTVPWLTPAVQRFAQAIYDDRDFDRLPILADMLEEAGCMEAAILEHFREPMYCNAWCHDDGNGHLCKSCDGGPRQLINPHVRGCWALDLILGRE